MWADNETSEDLLGFKVHADLLIDVINDDNVLPVTIGVFGDWGSGKSSILQIIKEEFDRKVEDKYVHKETLCIYFNGWTFEGYDDAKAALLESILKELEENEKLSIDVVESVKEKAKKIWKSIDWMRGASMVMKNVALPAVSAYFTGGLSLAPFALQKISEWGTEGTSKLIAKLQSEDGEEFYNSLLKKDESEGKTNQVREFRSDFEDLLKVTKFKRLVVLIDDLDRCTPDRIIENLEAIKLFLNVPKTAFIVGADPRIVRYAIEYKYKNNNKIEEDNVRIVDDYLEKLIQIPYSLPKLSEPEVETYISMLICKRELENSKFKDIYKKFQEFRVTNRYSPFGISNLAAVLNDDTIAFEKVKSNIITIPSLVPLIANSLYGNPRQIKRFLNTYTLRQRLANVASLHNFKDAVLAKLMILEYSELKLFRQLFEWQINQDGLPKQIQNIEKYCHEKSTEEALNQLQKNEFIDWSKPKIIKWLQIEPQLSKIDLRDYFWISRDKINSSITASSLIPQIVKILFNDLQVDGMTATITKSLIQKHFVTFSEIEKESFLNLLSINLKKNPKQKRFFDIFNYMLDDEIPNISPVYIETLKAIRVTDVEAAVGLSLSNYKTHQEMGGFLMSYFKDSKTPTSKAFNLNK